MYTTRVAILRPTPLVLQYWRRFPIGYLRRPPVEMLRGYCGTEGYETPTTKRPNPTTTNTTNNAQPIGHIADPPATNPNQHPEKPITCTWPRIYKSSQRPFSTQNHILVANVPHNRRINIVWLLSYMWAAAKLGPLETFLAGRPLFRYHVE